MDSRDILARKVRALMEASGGKYSNRAKLGRAAGVSARNIGYLLEGKGNPRLKTLEGVAGVFRLQAWELLIDNGTARQQLLGRIFGHERAWQIGDRDRRSQHERRGNGKDS